MQQTQGTDRLCAQGSQCLPSSCYFYPIKLPTLLAHLSTVQPSVPSSEQTTNLRVLRISKKGTDWFLAEIYSNELFPFYPALWVTLWSMQLPGTQGREDGRGQISSAKELSNPALYLLSESNTGTGPIHFFNMRLLQTATMCKLHKCNEPQTSLEEHR